MKITDNQLCPNCGEVESIMHLFYFCPLAKRIVNWFRSVLERLCSLETKSLLKILKLDFKSYSKKDRNTVIVLIRDYIAGVWYGYKVGLLSDDRHLISFIRGRMLRRRWILGKTYKESFRSLFTDKYVNNL